MIDKKSFSANLQQYIMKNLLDENYLILGTDLKCMIKCQHRTAWHSTTSLLLGDLTQYWNDRPRCTRMP